MRATLSFGLAGLLAAAGTLFPLAILISFPLAWLVGLISFPLAWLVASLLIRRRTVSAGRAAAATIMATGGGCLTGIIVLFSLISLQARIEPAWGAISWGLGFGLGGAIAGPSLSWYWVPADATSDRVRFSWLIAWLAFSFSGAVAGYLGFLGFATLHAYSLSLCVWLAYLLGGLLCDVGWKGGLSRSDSRLEESDSKASRPDEEAAVSVSDPEQRDA